MDVTINPTLSYWALHPHLLRRCFSPHQDDEDHDSLDDDVSACNVLLFARPFSQKSCCAQEEQQCLPTKRDDMNEWVDVQRWLLQEEEEEEEEVWLLCFPGRWLGLAAVTDGNRRYNVQKRKQIQYKVSLSDAELKDLYAEEFYGSEQGKAGSGSSSMDN